MQSSQSLSAKLTALVVFILSSAIVASAQSPQDRNPNVPTFKKENPVEVAAAPATTGSEAVPQLKPIVPAAPVVVESARPIPTEAQVIPPPPHLVKQAAGTIVLPSGVPSDGGYHASGAAIATPLQVNSAFGQRWGRRHTGIDFQASWGEAVGVSLAGTVVFAGIKHGYGNLVIVDHGNGISTYYAHLSAIYVGVGQALNANQVLGAIGSTGHSTGPHLHYEVRIFGRPINPTSTITSVNGEYYVNGQPFVQESAEPAQVEPTSSLSAPASVETRPRRVARQTATDKWVLVYGQNSLTSY
jgi:murein DD-endopeptidase MepM/ murein hydrolase activator NlpD